MTLKLLRLSDWVETFEISQQAVLPILTTTSAAIKLCSKCKGCSLNVVVWAEHGCRLLDCNLPSLCDLASCQYQVWLSYFQWKQSILSWRNDCSALSTFALSRHSPLCLVLLPFIALLLFDFKRKTVVACEPAFGLPKSISRACVVQSLTPLAWRIYTLLVHSARCFKPAHFDKHLSQRLNTNILPLSYGS